MQPQSPSSGMTTETEWQHRRRQKKPEAVWPLSFSGTELVCSLSVSSVCGIIPGWEMDLSQPTNVKEWACPEKSRPPPCFQIKLPLEWGQQVGTHKRSCRDWVPWKVDRCLSPGSLSTCSSLYPPQALFPLFSLPAPSPACLDGWTQALCVYVSQCEFLSACKALCLCQPLCDTQM